MNIGMLHQSEDCMLLPFLQPGSTIDLIAPAGKPHGELDVLLSQAIEYVARMGWHLRIPESLFGDDLLCSNTDPQRFDILSSALYAKDSQAVWCLRGGYGSARLMADLSSMRQPTEPKWFIGFSDVTALLCFLQQKWGWPVVHGPNLSGLVRGEALEGPQIQALLSGQLNQITLDMASLNMPAKGAVLSQTMVTGGNLSLLQSSIGTSWQISSKNKVLLIEEVHEVPYRVDRMLNHLSQAGIFSDVHAVIFGACTTKPECMPLMQQVLERFAKEQPYPVFQVHNIGHTLHNPPIVMGSPAEISAGRLTIYV